jgi:hypothetical protein
MGTETKIYLGRSFYADHGNGQVVIEHGEAAELGYSARGPKWTRATFYRCGGAIRVTMRRKYFDPLYRPWYATPWVSPALVAAVFLLAFVIAWVVTS